MYYVECIYSMIVFSYLLVFVANSILEAFIYFELGTHNKELADHHFNMTLYLSLIPGVNILLFIILVIKLIVILRKERH